jgi:MoaA/NifB/PqqE/SkfB family radical SAM enzyme
MLLARRVREFVLSRVRALRPAQHAWARIRRRRYDRSVARFLHEQSGIANRLPSGVVYEATMRCNLHCEFCYVGDLLNIEGEWRQEMSLDTLAQAFPAQRGLQVSLTGGEIFMRKDILSVLEVFQAKGYTCGYLTTNGTIINEERAEALARLAQVGFLKHISVSIDGPGDIHDRARGQKGTFERTSAGLQRLQAAARRLGAPLRVSINTTVAQESLAALDQMVEVAEELGVDAIGINHLMYATPEEVSETVRLVGAESASVISTFVTPDPLVDPEQVRKQVGRLERRCREKGIRFDVRPKVKPSTVDSYYTPGAPVEGRCLYPFHHARVSFSGKVYFCPFIRVEVGDLTHQSLEEVWNGPKYIELRQRLLEQKLFPVCRRCCKVELTETAVPIPEHIAARRRAIPLVPVS